MSGDGVLGLKSLGLKAPPSWSPDIYLSCQWGFLPANIPVTFPSARPSERKIGMAVGDGRKGPGMAGRWDPMMAEADGRHGLCLGVLTDRRP